MAKVTDLNAPFYGEVPPDQVLTGALKAGLDSVIVIGYKGDEIYFAFSSSEGPQFQWALEEAKKALME